MGFEVSPRPEEALTDGELTKLIMDCHEWMDTINDIRGYTRTGKPSRTTNPEMVSAAKMLYKSDYFIKRQCIAEYILQLRKAQNAVSADNFQRHILADYPTMIEDVRDEIYQDIASLNTCLSDIGMSATSLLRPTRTDGEAETPRAENIQRPPVPKDSPIDDGVGYRRAKLVKQTLDDFVRLQDQGALFPPFLDRFVGANPESPISVAMKDSPVRAWAICAELKRGRNDALAYKVVALCERISESSIKKAWLQHRDFLPP
ncbi:MAG: hypothetical protein ABR905_10605 [Terracidiphilus sp.]|jgi:hypothetical protein